MEYFEDYSEVDKNNKEKVYAFVAIGDTTPIQSTNDNKTLYLGDLLENSVNCGKWEGRPLDLNHEAEKGSYTIYGTIKKAFINYNGFIDNIGKKHFRVDSNYPVMYAIAELTNDGRELLKKYPEGLTTSSYFSYKDDEGELAKAHGDEDCSVVKVKEIEPISLSILTPDREPRYKLNEPYVINEKKNIDFKKNNIEKKDDKNMEEEKFNLIMNEIKNLKEIVNKKVLNLKEDFNTKEALDDANRIDIVKRHIIDIYGYMDSSLSREIFTLTSLSSKIKKLTDKKTKNEENEDEDKENKNEEEEDKENKNEEEDKENKNEDDKEDDKKDNKNEDDKEDKENTNEDDKDNKDKEDNKNSCKNNKNISNSKEEKVFTLKGFVL